MRRIGYLVRLDFRIHIVRALVLIFETSVVLVEIRDEDIDRYARLETSDKLIGGSQSSSIEKRIGRARI